MKLAIGVLCVVVLLLILWGLYLLNKLEMKDADYRSQAASPSEDARAIRDHEAAAREYMGMFDELYDWGEQIAQRKEPSHGRHAQRSE